MTIPTYVLSMDPGAKSTTWAYTVATVENNHFKILECGFVPILEDLSAIDLKPTFDFITRLKNTYREQLDFVAERFIARGFAAKHAEFIPFTLGVWYSHWKYGAAKLITASQWKVNLKKLNKHYKAPSKRYENWWEFHFESYTTEESRKKKAIHVQDSVAMSFWYYRKVLNINCKIDGLNF